MESQEALDPGLYLVSTPIGNLGDISRRAIEILKDCDLLYCEDTRHTRNLLNHLEIEKTLRSCHDHNEKKVAEEILDNIESGHSVALVSDAGTPAISDPGFRVVRACRREKVLVYTIPGPSAAIAALSISGLPTDQFHFLGFAPPKKAARKNFFSQHEDSDATLILYESVHRIEQCLRDLEAALGPDRIVNVSRELTKRFEESMTGRVEEIREQLASSSKKGEFVILVAKKGYSLA